MSCPILLRLSSFLPAAALLASGFLSVPPEAHHRDWNRPTSGDFKCLGKLNKLTNLDVRAAQQQ
jgi:hypothetical protein